MEFKRGNRAIRDHVKDGKQLLLFEALGRGKPVSYRGEFTCTQFDYGRGPDRNGDERQTIRFHLVPAGTNQLLEDDAVVSVSRNLSLEDLRRRAIAATNSSEESDWRVARTVQRARSQLVKEYVLRRADGTCEMTGDPAPFTTRDGSPYLEVHHIQRLSDGGLDHPANCAAITPNAHREIHYGTAGADLDRELLLKIREKEAAQA